LFTKKISGCRLIMVLASRASAMPCETLQQCNESIAVAYSLTEGCCNAQARADS